jgi:hypothetical protein
MKLKNKIVLGTLCSVITLASALADNRLFTYTYEPETTPHGEFEFEQSVTSRLGRNETVGQQDYQKWEFREELEYGVTENYSASLYLNSAYTRFHDPETSEPTSNYRFTGVSMENKFMVLNPADHAVGLSLYLEPAYDGKNFELEQKIILGQRHGDWKWAVNLTHATEWTDYFRQREGEVELSAGLARQLNRRWSLGLEVRDHNEIPEYKEWENTALFIGPAISYRRSGWWATVSVMPQVFGMNFTEDSDNNHHLDLEGHERVNIRLLFGIEF